ncbi:MAG: hypothetical protein AABX60_02285 [Nanoarchaeota archaeon]
MRKIMAAAIAKITIDDTMKELTKCPNCEGPVKKEVKAEGTCYNCEDQEGGGWGICV